MEHPPKSDLTKKTVKLLYIRDNLELKIFTFGKVANKHLWGDFFYLGFYSIVLWIPVFLFWIYKSSLSQDYFHSSRYLDHDQRLETRQKLEQRKWIITWFSFLLSEKKNSSINPFLTFYCPNINNTFILSWETLGKFLIFRCFYLERHGIKNAL